MPRKPRIGLSALMLALLPSLSAAENVLMALPAPEERPYPYKILGLQPGMALDDVMAIFAERSDAEPTGRTEIVQVRSADGRVFEFTYERSRTIGDVGVSGRMAGVDQDQIGVGLSSTALEQRPIGISRSLRKPSGELPDAAAIRAQLEALYGPPSRVETSYGKVEITYAWGYDGFIQDLDAQEPHQVEYTSMGFQRTSSYLPCTRSQHGAYLEDTSYVFQYPRERDIMPGCIARFVVTHETRPGTTTIHFGLSDYELSRFHRDGLDAQIIDYLMGDAGVEASDIEM